MQEIRKFLEEGKLVLGSKVVIKKLRNKELEKLYISNNCKQEIKEHITKIAKLGSIEIIELEMTNEELGTYCRKPFHISIVGVLKG